MCIRDRCDPFLFLHHCFLLFIQIPKPINRNAAGITPIITTFPVSYTHLDVYKRQVLFSVCARYFPLSPWTRIFNLLAWASPRLEQLPTSKYFFCRGDHASTSQDFTFRSARSPEQHSSVRTGTSRERNLSLIHISCRRHRLPL